MPSDPTFLTLGYGTATEDVEVEAHNRPMFHAAPEPAPKSPQQHDNGRRGYRVHRSLRVGDTDHMRPSGARFRVRLPRHLSSLNLPSSPLAVWSVVFDSTALIPSLPRYAHCDNSASNISVCLCSMSVLNPFLKMECHHERQQYPRGNYNLLMSLHRKSQQHFRRNAPRPRVAAATHTTPISTAALM